ncbi:MAG: WD40 repeat domain-containing protein, partial [Chloroflexota bacterium]
SGSGKSSVVKAGMLPRIQAGDLNPDKSWYTAEIVPGTHPMEELEVALLALATHDMPDLHEMLTRDERGFVRAIKRIIPENAEFLLFIDQFEEAFTLVSDEDERIHFLHSILNAVHDERSRIKVIVTLRADFYDRPLLYADFGNLIRTNTELVLPLSQRELEASIIEPAKRVGITLEAGLVQAITNDVIERPGALPLLQYALTELFERRSGRVMTLLAYQDIGGTTGALARRAEELFQSFNGEEKNATRQLFMRLVTLGEGTDDTRRRAMQSELLSLNIGAHAMRTVIEQFGKYRLLTFDHDPQTRGSTVEVAHEALIRQWERVRGWLDENREALRLHRRLTSATDEWEQSRRDMSFLARGMRLQQFETILEDNDIALNKNEKIFLEMSVDARQQRDQEERERKQREEMLEERARRRLQLLASVLAIAALVSIGFAGFAYLAQQDAQRSAAEADDNFNTAVAAQSTVEDTVRELSTSQFISVQREAETRSLALAANARNAANLGDPQLAIVIALEAEEAFSPPPVEVLRTLSNVVYAPGPRAQFNNHSASVTNVDFSADSQFLISASVDGTVRVVDVATQAETLVLSVDGIWFNDANMHPNNNEIAAVGSDGSLYVWDYPSGQLRYQQTEHSGEVFSLDYSPDGTLLVTSGLDHDIHLWDSATGDLIRTLSGHTGVVLQVVFSPDGQLIASGSADETMLNTRDDEVDRTVRLWDVATGTEVMDAIKPESGFVRALDFSPTGDTLAYGVYDGTNSGTIRIHNVATGAEIRRFIAHTTPVTAVAYSADGSQIASVAWDRTVHIWDLRLGVEADSFVGFDDRVLSMAYSPNGNLLALGIGNIGNNEFDGNDLSNTHVVWLWDINNGVQIARYSDHPDWAWTVDLHPSGRLAASSGGPLSVDIDINDPQAVAALYDSTTVNVWDVETQTTLYEFRAHTNTVDSVRFHPDGNRLLTSSWDSQIILWDFEAGERLRNYNGHTGRVYMVRFIGDGSRFVSVGSDGLLILWDTESGEIIYSIKHGESDPIALYGVDVSMDQQQLAVTADNGDIYLYDINTQDLMQTLVGHGATANEVRYNPSDLFLVSTSWDGTIRVWERATGMEVRQFTGHASETFGIDFTSDGAIMLTTSSDRTVRMWDWATGEELQRFTEHTNWIQEVQFDPDDSFAVSAGQDNAVRIWRINRDAESLVQFALDNRFIRDDLSCSEREVNLLESCE